MNALQECPNVDEFCTEPNSCAQSGCQRVAEASGADEAQARKVLSNMGEE